MGIAKEALHQDIGYSAWANRRLLNAAATLTEEERERDLEQSHRNVLATLHHMYEGERFWADCLISHQMPPMDEIGETEATPPPRLEELNAKWPGVWEELDRWLAAQPDEALAETLRCRLSAGKEFAFARWQLLRHLVNHSSLHRGQIVGMLRAMGKQPPNVDLMSYIVRK